MNAVGTSNIFMETLYQNQQQKTKQATERSLFCSKGVLGLEISEVIREDNLMNYSIAGFEINQEKTAKNLRIHFKGGKWYNVKTYGQHKENAGVQQLIK